MGSSPTPHGPPRGSSAALSFNGVNSYVTIADSASLDLTSGMTLEAWVKPTALTGWRDVLLKERPSGLSYALYATDPRDAGVPPNAQIVHGSLSQGAETTASAGLKLNQWSFLSATYDGSVLRMYVNGRLVGSRSVSSPIDESNGALQIGGNSVWGQYFKGLIDNVRVYNKALSQSQIQTDMTTPVPPPSSSAPLQATITGLPPLGYSPKGTTLTLGSQVSGGVGADKYSWTVTENGATVATGTASSLSFTPSSTGTYQVALTVTDSANHTASASGSVVVDLPPTVSLFDPAGQAGSAIPFTASANNPNVGEAAGFTYSWNFGDGKTDSGTSPTDSHVYAAAGTYTATVTATDSVGESGNRQHDRDRGGGLDGDDRGAAGVGIQPGGDAADAGVLGEWRRRFRHVQLDGDDGRRDGDDRHGGVAVVHADQHGDVPGRRW